MERLTLTADECGAVAALAERAVSGEVPHDPQEVAVWVSVHAPLLPVRLRQFLAAVRSREIDLAVVSGLPIGPGLQVTPQGWAAAAESRAGWIEEWVLLLCASGLAEPFAWATQQNGRLVHDVCPVAGMEQSLTSASSRAALSLHTEDVFHPCRGDYVALYCLRNPDRVATTVARLSSCRLDSDLVRVLSQHRFWFWPDDSHRSGADHLPRSRRPDAPAELGSVLFGPEERPYLRFDPDFIGPDEGDYEAQEAIDELAAVLGAAVEEVVLTAGDLAILDNHQVVHGRNPFTPRFDGNDRWLKRVNLVRDSRRIYVSTRARSRIITPSTKSS